MPSSAVVSLIDLSGLPQAAARAALADLGRADRLGRLVARAIVLLPTGCAVEYDGPWSLVDSSEGPRACAWAFDLAAGADAALLIVGGGAMPSGEMVSQLLEAFELDPLFGMAVPRFVSAESGRLLLAKPFGPSADTAPLRVLAVLPDYQVITECAAPVAMLRRELVGNLTLDDAGATGVWPSLVAYGVRARRAGFRTVICNRTIVTVEETGVTAAWGCPPGALVAIRHAWPDLARVEDEYQRSAERSAERLLAAAFDRPRSLLLDARNLTPLFNGTTTVILLICDALHRARPDADVTLWAPPDSATHHNLERRYPAWRVSTTIPTEHYAAALRLSQPWYEPDLDLLGRLAAVNTYWMLDTIAWDVVYCAPPRLDSVWQRVAAEADGLFFISTFSRQRFENRFTASPFVALQSCPLSLEASDYQARVSSPGPEEPYWLVVGNQYDHKHIGATVDLLARAFPTQRLIVFGDRNQPRTDRVTRFDSGAVDNDTMHACYAHAEAVIFPSFYEGFGLPTVQGLAYGRTVVTRASALVEELAAAYRGPGRLVTFDSERALVAILERLSRGESIEPMALATGNAQSWTWDSAAAMLLSHIERMVANCPSPQLAIRAGLARGITHPARKA